MSKMNQQFSLIFFLPNNLQNHNILSNCMSYYIYFQNIDGMIPSLYEADGVQNYPYPPSNGAIPQFNSFQTVTYGNSQYSIPNFQAVNTHQEYPVGLNQLNPFQARLPEELTEIKKRKINSEKQTQSAKKNGESNIVNQFFSMFNNRQKSQKILDTCVGTLTQDQAKKEKLMHLFYNTIQILNVKRGRKYVNRKLFKTIFDPQEMANVIPEIKQKIDKLKEVTISELCQLFRKCCFGFYRTLSIDAVLTSKRISSNVKLQHFKKRRKVKQALNDLE